MFAGDGIKYCQLGIETVIPFPKTSNWLLAPVESFRKLGRVIFIAHNLISARCASSYSFIALPAITLAQRLAQRQVVIVKKVSNT